MPAGNDLHFRASERASGWLDRQAELTHAGTRHAAAKAVVEAFPDLLAAELHRVRLTLAQACCLGDVLNGSMFEMHFGTRLGLAYAECYDAFRLAREDTSGNPLPVPHLSSYGAKWGPEGSDPVKWEQDLLDLLGRLGPAADLALRGAVAAWWDEGQPGTAAGFASVGLLVTGAAE